jgi:hypothetical protein
MACIILIHAADIPKDNNTFMALLVKVVQPNAFRFRSNFTFSPSTARLETGSESYECVDCR